MLVLSLARVPGDVQFPAVFLAHGERYYDEWIQDDGWDWNDCVDYEYDCRRWLAQHRPDVWTHADVSRDPSIPIREDDRPPWWWLLTLFGMWDEAAHPEARPGAWRNR